MNDKPAPLPMQRITRSVRAGDVISIGGFASIRIKSVGGRPELQIVAPEAFTVRHHDKPAVP